MLCQFQVYGQVTQLYIYMYPFFQILFPVRLLQNIMKVKVKVKVAQSCLTLCNPMEYTVHEYWGR